MFIITLPLMTHVTTLQIGKGSGEPREAVTVDVDFDGTFGIQRLGVGGNE